ncbi:serine-threonine protein kinase-like protein [Trypanosoma grayi]|uniref:serine-threonine protein kinase-like protein n=1 Tax=Trypanosoma grayi TaxID=71804 RepID=UPI0004F4ADF2|nr:serine-threonine protein kinase-like protein [Trypanosoma grayi]KEG13773.1 serine-threonine protein kinase-like protein [Trypanosoma grayi]
MAAVTRAEGSGSRQRNAWGVLVAQNMPTEENGLQPFFLLQRQLQQDEQNKINELKRYGEGMHPVILLWKERVTFGRRAGNDVVINGNPCLSGTHCGLSIQILSAVSSPPTVTFTDYSTNGCQVNNMRVGKGASVDLRSGDTIHLVNAGPNKHTRHNLCFVFYTMEDYKHHRQQKRLYAVETMRGPTPSIGAKRERSASPRRDDRKETTDNGAPHADSHLWAWALARRMYRHSVEEFYILQKSKPLGEGAFSVVYPAALRPTPEVVIRADCAPGVILKSPQLQDEEAALRFLELQPCKSVVKATELALENAARRRHRKVETMPDGSEGIVYNFAVKVIEKKRMLFPAEARQRYRHRTGDDCLLQPSTTVGKNGGKRSEYVIEVDSCDSEQQALQQLVALETQTQEREHGRAQELLLECPANRTIDALGEFPAVESELKEQLLKEDRVQHREQLLSQLGPATRLRYEKELRQKMRHKCEIDILLAVDHPAITKLHEVFDGERRLELVMEQATGGEVLNLLHGNGPLPEFVVKVIVYQVLEAVLYLHRTGITHRDLKLENLLLQQPFELGSFCELQQALLLQKLMQFLRAFEEDSSPKDLQEEETNIARVPNPFSVLHTVHVGRSLWPKVQISDFGLSRMLEGKVNDDNGNGYDNLLYTRNDMVTMCGTPIYVAPEVVIPSLRPNKVGYSAAVDMFSVGVVAFALLTGRAPFPPARAAEISPKHGRLDYDAPLHWERSKKHKKIDMTLLHSTAPVQLPPLLLQDAATVHLTPSAPYEHQNQQLRHMKSVCPSLPQAEWLNTIRKAAEALQEAPPINILHENVVLPQNSSYAQFLPSVSALGRELITSLLDSHAQRRPTAAEAILHPWFFDCTQ